MHNTNCEAALDTRLLQGTILDVSETGCLVAFDEESLLCRRAASCLLDPEAGDIILAVVSAENEPSFILSILERMDADTATTLTLAPDAVIRAEGGRLSVRSRTAIDINCIGGVSLSAERFDISASEGNWLIRSLSIMGNNLDSVWKDIRNTASSIRTVCTTSLQYLGDSFRHVKNLDESSAENIRLMASDTLQHNAKFINTTAVEVVKIDGQEVHLG